MNAVDRIVEHARKLHTEAAEKHAAGDLAKNEGNAILAMGFYAEADKILDTLDGIMIALNILEGKA